VVDQRDLSAAAAALRAADLGTAAADQLSATVPLGEVGAATATDDLEAATAADDEQVGAGGDADCSGSPAGPLPAPGTAGAQDFFRSFRLPLAAAPVYNAPGPKRVGLQAGHWLTDQVPPELGRLQAGASGGGKQEWQVNLDVAERAAALLEARGMVVDVLPSTIPPGYQAHAFIALHADGDPAGVARGFKIARPGFSSIPEADDRLVDTLNDVYAAGTDLPRDDDHISLRMRYYYAFNSRRYCHAVARGVPQAIVEMGYLTSAVDRQWLIGSPDRLARALADGIQRYLTPTS
jgi:N-acetylmuramoyl-L-alanine amidase